MEKIQPKRTSTKNKKAKAGKSRRRFQHGVWEDRHGNLHFSVAELLVKMGLRDNAKNRADVLRTVGQMFKQRRNGGKLINRELIPGARVIIVGEHFFAGAAGHYVADVKTPNGVKGHVRLHDGSHCCVSHRSILLA